jgi:peptide subunit release factor RF-3
MKDEYGVDTTLDALSFSIARWVKGGWPAVQAAGRMFNTQVCTLVCNKLAAGADLHSTVLYVALCI